MWGCIGWTETLFSVSVCELKCPVIKAFLNRHFPHAKTSLNTGILKTVGTVQIAAFGGVPVLAPVITRVQLRGAQCVRSGQRVTRD